MTQEDLVEALDDLRLEVAELSKRCEALELSQSVARRKQSRLAGMWENAFGGFNHERDEILVRVGRLELVVNQLQAHKELIG